MSTAAVVVPIQKPVAAIFNLDDPGERRIFDAIQAFYADRDRLHAIRRGTIDGPSGPIRMLWTLGSFRPARRGARVEWSVSYWYIGEITVRFQRCPDEPTARAVYKHAGNPDERLSGLRLKKR